MFNRVNHSLEILVCGYIIEIVLMKYSWPAEFRTSFKTLKQEGLFQVLWKVYQFQFMWRKDHGGTVGKHLQGLEKLVQRKFVTRHEVSVFSLNSW